MNTDLYIVKTYLIIIIFADLLHDMYGYFTLCIILVCTFFFLPVILITIMKHVLMNINKARR